jgi:hypothetical protein
MAKESRLDGQTTRTSGVAWTEQPGREAPPPGQRACLGAAIDSISLYVCHHQPIIANRNALPSLWSVPRMARTQAELNRNVVSGNTDPWHEISP